jgi:hypothetical protein
LLKILKRLYRAVVRETPPNEPPESRSIDQMSRESIDRMMTGIPMFIPTSQRGGVGGKRDDDTKKWELLNSFLAAEPAEMRRLIEAQGRVLLDPALEAALRKTAVSHMLAGDFTNDSGFLTAHADLLAACRAKGVTAAFAEWEAQRGA